MEYTYDNPQAYDNRHKNVMEIYLHDIWFPFLENRIKKLSENKDVLEIGCGTCEYTKTIEDPNLLVGLDSSIEMLEHGSKKVNCLLVQGDAHNLPFGHDSFDLIICIGLLEYVSFEKLLKESNKVLKNKGMIMIAVTNKWNPFHLLIRNYRLFKDRNYERKERSILKLRKCLKSKGYTILEEESFGMIFYSPLFLQKYSLYLWKFLDHIWKPFQKKLPLGHMLYILAQKDD